MPPHHRFPSPPPPPTTTNLPRRSYNHHNVTNHPHPHPHPQRQTANVLEPGEKRFRLFVNRLGHILGDVFAGDLGAPVQEDLFLQHIRIVKGFEKARDAREKEVWVHEADDRLDTAQERFLGFLVADELASEGGSWRRMGVPSVCVCACECDDGEKRVDIG